MAPFEDVGVREMFHYWGINPDSEHDRNKTASVYRWAKEEMETDQKKRDRSSKMWNSAIAAILTIIVTPMVGLLLQYVAKRMGVTWFG